VPFDLHKDFAQGSWGDLPWLRRNCNIILEPHLTSDYTDVETLQPRNGEPEGMEGVLRDQLTGIPMSGTFPPSRLALVQTVRRLEGDLRTAQAQLAVAIVAATEAAAAPRPMFVLPPAPPALRQRMPAHAAFSGERSRYWAWRTQVRLNVDVDGEALGWRRHVLAWCKQPSRRNLSAWETEAAELAAVRRPGAGVSVGAGADARMSTSCCREACVADIYVITSRPIRSDYFVLVPYNTGKMPCNNGRMRPLDLKCPCSTPHW
jgi:hypothetical protein